MMKQISWVDINLIHPNGDNPRTITDNQMEKLKKSIQEFPNMLELRPLVVDGEMVVLGGNMRLEALKQLGYTQVPILKVDDLTEEQKREFVIKDNLAYGEWDWDILQVEWDMEQLQEWGVIHKDDEPQVDYSILDDEELEGLMGNMEKGVMRGIQLEFYPEDYDKCQELISWWREQGAYIGGMLIEYLRVEKEKLML